MTKEQLSFMFNKVINGFYIKKDILVTRQKVAGKKKFYVIDMRTDETKENCFNNIDELFDFKINGETIEQLIKDKKDLNVSNVWE